MSSRILVLGTADWSQPIATNQHYVVRELAREFDIIYTESMGLRTPELNMRDIRRIARRAGLGTSAEKAPPPREVPARVEVRSPKVLPRHVGLAARFNAPRVRKLVADWIDHAGSRILWTYSPVTYGLDEIADAVVYHCVDLLGEVEGIPTDLINREEQRLSKRATVAIGTSPVVVNHLLRREFEKVEFWPNVADVEVIEAARPTHPVRVPGRAVFAGNLSITKVDFVLLQRLLDSGVDLHLAGPIAEGGGSAASEVQALCDGGATYHGMLDPTALAELYWTAEVGLIPYVMNSYTRGVSPLKTYEYLAAGLTVVSTEVPSVQSIGGSVKVVGDPAGFVEAVTSRSSFDADLEQVRFDLASGFSWTGRGKVARGLVRSLAT